MRLTDPQGRVAHAGRFRDPFGHVWIVASRVEEVSTEEMRERMDALYGG